ncbi:MAG: aspartate racemase [Bacteroidetes bacterium GWB2_41_8]|nr:MAG: aspartate racemase [Bacteroidetes bacterium GWB2_41_8]
MKRIGIIGGLGPEATVDYYKEIINAFKNGNGDLDYPEIIIYSVNMAHFIRLMREKKYDQATAYISEKIEGLKQAGADFAALSANTPHQLFDQLRERSGIPLISIVEATCNEAKSKGLKRAGLFGTEFTMNASFFPEVFKKKGIEVIMPGEEDKELINYKLFSEIELGIFKDETRELLIGIIEKMVREQHIDSLILGCTEFPLILTAETYAGIPILNTTKIHVESIAKYCRESQ